MRRPSARATCTAWKACIEGRCLTTDALAATFDPDTLALLGQRQEVHVETTRLDGRRIRTIIWVVVVNDRVYVRSYRGDRGHWYQSALERPGEVALIADGKVIPAHAVWSPDAASIAECSAGLEEKYRKSRSLPFMLEPHTLESTLRIEPRQAHAD